MGHRRFDESKHNIQAASTLIVGISRFTKSVANPDGYGIIRSSYAASFGRNSPYNTADILLPTTTLAKAAGYPGIITNICVMTVALQLILTAYTFKAELMRGKKLVIFFVPELFLIDAIYEKIWEYERNGFRALNQRAMPLNFWKQYEILQDFWVRLEDYGIVVVMHKCSENFGATGMAQKALGLENPV